MIISKLESQCFETAVLFMAFNRPSLTARVFESIRNIRPSNLYISLDGPRENNEEDLINCKKVKSIVQSVDWTCNVHYSIREQNHGCKIAVSSAIDWFFENENEGIILEDDCLPNIDFFLFCESLLRKYRHDARVMHISGSSYLNKNELGEEKASYYFSRNTYVWGWATWKRAWKQYDIKMSTFIECSTNKMIEKYFLKSFRSRYLKRVFMKTYYNEVNTWDYQWAYTVLTNNGLSIVPKLNLVQNIGLEGNGTHSQSSFKGKFCISPNNISQEIIHPKFFMVDTKADLEVFYMVFFTDFISKVWRFMLNPIKYLKEYI